jgi:hypothetical protein
MNVRPRSRSGSTYRVVLHDGSALILPALHRCPEPRLAQIIH